VIWIQTLTPMRRDKLVGRSTAHGSGPERPKEKGGGVSSRSAAKGKGLPELLPDLKVEGRRI